MKQEYFSSGVSKTPSKIIFLNFLLFATFLVWASFTEIDEVTRAEGKVVPSSKIQTVQSTEAGVVKQILVREGQQVKEGEVLVRLDDTLTSSSHGEAQAKALALKVQIARLKIEEKEAGINQFQCPSEIIQKNQQICENEKNLLQARYENYKNKVSVLKERREQRIRELAETDANINRLTKSLKLAKKELDLLTPLAKRKLISQTDLIKAQQNNTELQGQLIAAKESRGRIQSGLREAEVQIKEASSFFRQEALREITEKLSELSVVEETLRGASERVRNTDIRSPVSGVINKLHVTTLGAFVQAGAYVIDVVPLGDNLLVEARVKPEDIAFIRHGQNALIKITSYDFSIYGGIDGKVDHISADSVLDKDTKEAFYIGLIKTKEAFIEHHKKKLPIIPGMICQVDILTGRKSILDYLLKPVKKAMNEALGER